MTGCTRASIPAVVALLLFASGCPTTGKCGGGVWIDAGIVHDLGVISDGGALCADVDAAAYAYPNPGGRCCDEGHYECWTPTYQCCHGVWIEYYDGPCQPVPDAGPPNCAASPQAQGCPCTVGEPNVCNFVRPRLECVGGVWTSSSTHACCS